MGMLTGWFYLLKPSPNYPIDVSCKNSENGFKFCNRFTCERSNDCGTFNFDFIL